MKQATPPLWLLLLAVIVIWLWEGWERSQPPSSSGVGDAPPDDPPNDDSALEQRESYETPTLIIPNGTPQEIRRATFERNQQQAVEAAQVSLLEAKLYVGSETHQ
jgi:hypothetical protein